MPDPDSVAVSARPLSGSDAWELLGTYGGHVHFVADRFTRIRYVTPNAQELLGRDAKELIGVSMFDLYHEKDLARIGDGYEAALYGGELVLARHRIHTAKGDVWVESASRAVGKDGETLVLTSLRREPGNPDAAWTEA